MGIFDRFKKKESEDTPRRSDAAEVLRLLAEKYDDCVLGVDSLYFRQFDLTLRAEIGNVTEKPENCSVQIIFVMEHPLFGDEMVESCAGLGTDRNDALKMGTESFAAGVLTFVFCALSCEGYDLMETAVLGQRSVFRVPCTRGTFHLGDHFIKKTDLWALISDEIPKYLGRKPVYWIKLFASWTGSELVCEMRINGIVYPELTKKLEEKIGEPDRSAKYGIEKQFVVLVQDDETLEPCPYTRKQVLELTAAAIEKLYAVNSQESYSAAAAEIRGMCPDSSLAAEMLAFIPEIFCQTLFGLKCSDSLIAVNGEQQEIVRKSQLRSYGYIEEAVFRCISQNMPSQQQYLGVLGTSNLFRAVDQAAEAGADLDKLTFTEVPFAIDDDHVIW